MNQIIDDISHLYKCGKRSDISKQEEQDLAWLKVKETER